MDACKEYIDRGIIMMQLCDEGKADTQEVKNIEVILKEIWDNLSEDEQLYVDEQILRLQTYK